MDGPLPQSPYRIVYGIHNPAVRGPILTPDVVIPSFSWTPRLAIDDEALRDVLKRAVPDNILCGLFFEWHKQESGVGGTGRKRTGGKDFSVPERLVYLR